MNRLTVVMLAVFVTAAVVRGDTGPPEPVAQPSGSTSEELTELFTPEVVSELLITAPPEVMASAIDGIPTTFTIPGAQIAKLLDDQIPRLLFDAHGKRQTRRRAEKRSVESTDGVMTIEPSDQEVAITLNVQRVTIRGVYVKTRRFGSTKKRAWRARFYDIKAGGRYNVCMRPVKMTAFGGVTIRRVGIEGAGLIELLEGIIEKVVRPLAIRALSQFIRVDSAALIDDLLGDQRLPICSTPTPECVALAESVNASASAVEEELMTPLDIETELTDGTVLAVTGVSNVIAFDNCMVKASTGLLLLSPDDQAAAGTAVLTATVTHTTGGACFKDFQLSSAAGAFVEAGGTLEPLTANLPTEPICVNLPSVTTTSTTSISAGTTTSTMTPGPPLGIITSGVNDCELHVYENGVEIAVVTKPACDWSHKRCRICVRQYYKYKQSRPTVAVDSQDRIHVAIGICGEAQDAIVSLVRQPDGRWDPPIRLPGDGPCNWHESGRTHKKEWQGEPPALPNSWYTAAWSPCSAACGGGEQTRVVECRSYTGETVADSLCAAVKPVARQVCNTQSCFAWTVASWDTCSVSCGGGTRQRAVSCRDSRNGATVSDSLCLLPKPTSSEACNTQSCYAWVVGSWGTCSVSCGGGTRQRAVSCRDSRNGATVSDSLCLLPKPKSSEACNTQPCWTAKTQLVCGGGNGYPVIARSVTFQCGSGDPRYNNQVTIVTNLGSAPSGTRVTVCSAYGYPGDWVPVSQGTSIPCAAEAGTFGNTTTIRKL